MEMHVVIQRNSKLLVMVVRLVMVVVRLVIMGTHVVIQGQVLVTVERLLER